MQRIDEKLQIISTIAKIHRANLRELNRRLSKLNLSYIDFLVLRAISDGPRSMVYLTNKYFVTQAAITVTVDRLEEKGLAKRIRDKRDRRVVMKGIIEDGLRTLNEGMKIYEELVEEILNGINEDEIRELLSKLNLILSRIESSID